MKYGNLIDLRGLSFDDMQNGNYSSWIQAMPIGKYQHPMYGTIDITPERVQRFADNVNNGARGQALDIDYDHKQHHGKAAGWVQKAEARPNGLWLLVEWVKDAYADIKNKAYRYFSPEFTDEWTHPSTGQKFEDVLAGGGITNRPFLKGILPLNLSEVFAENESTESTEGNFMFTDEERAALLAKFNLPEDADDQTILQALIAAASAAQADEPTPNTGGSENPTDNGATANSTPENGANGNPSQVTVKFSEAELKQLSENPTTKKLLEAMQANAAALHEMQTTSLVAAINKKFADKGKALPPVVTEALTETVKLSENDQFTGAIIQMMSKLAETGIIELGEGPATDPATHTRTSVNFTKSLSEKAEKLSKETGMAFGDAMVQVVNENPEAYTAHRADSYIV